MVQGPEASRQVSRGRVLVVGARPGSLGEAVASTAAEEGWEVTTTGISDEQVALDLVNADIVRIEHLLVTLQPRHIVCTAGVNMPEPGIDQEQDLKDWYRWHFEANVIGPMRMLDAWRRTMAEEAYEKVNRPDVRHYVTISSNSAFIPRRNSSAYCASKAALSMATRVAAREACGGDYDYIVYGYEPGLLSATPMTQQIEGRFAGPLHRMQGEQVAAGVPVPWLAGTIVCNLGQPGVALNGALLRFDAGEQ